MFRTYPEAELKRPIIFGANSERCWNWIELSLYIPYFYISLELNFEEGKFTRQFMFSQLRDLLYLIESDKYKTMKVLNIMLMSPAYMNGGDSYQFDKIKEIWETQAGTGNRFVLCDGRKLHTANLMNFDDDQEIAMDMDMRLILSI